MEMTTGYRTPLILTAGIAVVLGVVAVMLLTRSGAGNPQAMESPPTQMPTHQPTALVATTLDPQDAAEPEQTPSEYLAAAASVCGSGATVVASLESDGLSLTVMDGEVLAGDLLSMPIVLSQAPAGLAGYYVRLNIDDPKIARLAGINFPNFGLVREVDSSEHRARIAAADLQRVVEAGDSDSTLATLTVEGAKKGATFIQLSVIQMDDDSGDPMTPQVYSGTVTVC